MDIIRHGKLCLNFKKYLILAVIFAPLSLFPSKPKADWTLVVFVQANNSLKNFAQTNFNAMGSIGSSANLNILVQCYFPQNIGAYRYKVEKGKMVLDSHINDGADGTNSNDLVEAVRWAVTKYPADKYALVLWNHGIGILDPVWGKMNGLHSSQRFYIEEEMLLSNPRIQIQDLTVDKTYTCTTQSSPQLVENTFTEEEIVLLDKAVEQDCNSTKILRGILFNEQSKTYMTNQGFTNALQEIKRTVLNGKKIDLLGMDACLMAMVEVGYQSRQFAKYLVASEESELAHGWDYGALCKMLSEKASPQQVACGMVSNYESFYRNKIEFYTLSAIDLSKMDDLKNHIDTLTQMLQECKSMDKNTITNYLKKARSSCQQFSAANYVDFYSFLTELLKQMNQVNASTHTKIQSKTLSDTKLELQKSINLIDQTVVANTAGKVLAGAKGLSIYFPLYHIDRSYLQTDFGQESFWTTMIKDLLPLGN